MNNNIKKKLIMFLCCICIATASGCGSVPSSLELIDQGTKEFAQGKTEEKYILEADNSVVVQKLLEEYVAQRENPQPMDPDAVEHAVDVAERDDSIIPDTGKVISSRNDFKRAMRKMMDETLTTYCCEISGYQVSTELEEELLHELEREEPIDSTSISTFGWSQRGDKLYIFYEYDIDEKQLKEIKKETRTLVEQAASEIDATGLKEAGIVDAVNEYLCDLITYPEENLAKYPGRLEGYAPLEHTAYSAFKYGSAVCDGYARAAMLLLDMFDVKADFVIGECFDGGNHAWNLVNVEGSWYHLDVCWNDTDDRKKYELVTDEFMKETREWDDGVYPISSLKNF